MMNLTPTEMDRLIIFTAAELARRYRGQGVPLSQPEAEALITDECLLLARKGHPPAEVAEQGRHILTSDDVLPGVAEQVRVLYVEALFDEGTKLVTVFDPIQPGEQPLAEHRRAGEIFCDDDDIELNGDRERATITVTNTADRAIQVCSHFHFFEVNKALDFDRAAAFGMRLDIPSGASLRFEPGVSKVVQLVDFGGERMIHGFNQLTEGSVASDDIRRAALQRAQDRGYQGA